MQAPRVIFKHKVTTQLTSQQRIIFFHFLFYQRMSGCTTVFPRRRHDFLPHLTACQEIECATACLQAVLLLLRKSTAAK